jgi:hypothetical protein
MDRAAQLEREVAAEQARWRLRQVQAQHHELDEREAASVKSKQEEVDQARREAQEQEQLRLKTEQQTKERRWRELEAEVRARHRRQLVQGVKNEVLDGWGGLRALSDSLHGIPREVRAQALKEIERELSELPGDELPRSELVEIAEGVRDRVYRPWLQQREETQRREVSRQELIRQGVEERQAALGGPGRSVRREEGTMAKSQRKVSGFFV